MPSYFNKEKLRQGIAFTLITLLLIFFFFSLKNLITSFLGSILFYVLFKPFMHRLVHIRKWKKSLAATLIIFISFLIVVVPLIALSYMLYSKVSNVINDPTSLIQSLHKFDDKVKSVTGVGFINDATFQKVKIFISNLIPDVLNQTLQILSGLLIMYFILYYLLIDTERDERDILIFLPFSVENSRLFFRELESMTVSNAIAVPMIAALQGFLASICFWIFGLHEPFFWGVICGCCSVIPVIGSGLIWIPAGLFTIALGNTGQGLGILIYGLVIISLFDNVFRFLFQKKFADIHPVITILGVIIGLKWFGLPGLVFGPLLISYFLILIRIYRHEYLEETSKP